VLPLPGIGNKSKFFFIAGIAGFVSVIGLGTYSLQRLKEGVELHRAAYSLQGKLDKVLESLQDADIAFLTFKINRDQKELTRLHQRISEVKQQLDHLIELSRPNESLFNEVKNFRKLLDEKVKTTDQIIYTRDEGKGGPSYQRFFSVQSDLMLTSTIRDRIDLIDRAMQLYLQNSQRFVDEKFFYVSLLLVFAAAVTMVLLLMFGMMVAKEIARRARMEADLRRAQDSAISASNLKSQFLATVSHEIRTPLNGIIGMSDLLLHEPMGSQGRKFAEIIHTAGKTLLRIVNDILDFSKIEAGKVEFEVQEIRLDKVIRFSSELFSEKAREKGNVLELKLDPRLGWAFAGDGGRISQILQNLISNAIKFTQNGKITVTGKLTEEKGGAEAKIDISIEDTGIGIARDRIKKVFEPFVQGAAATGTSEGTGLGLSISRKLAEGMGGTISVESVAAPSPNQGSTFRFQKTFRILNREIVEVAAIADNRSHLIPSYASSTHANTNHSKLTLPTLPGFADKVILVVEDNTTNQILIQTLLEQMGLRVQTVGSGKECLESLSRQNYDLILMDCRMPGLDGYQTTEQIRANERANLSNPGSRIPIVALTANAIVGDVDRCFAAGMDAYLSKPVDSALLRETLEKYLGESRTPELEMSTLRDLARKTNRTVVHKLLHSFNETLTSALSQLPKRLESGDYEFISALAHQLKSSSLAIGAKDFSSQCQRVEESIDLSTESKSLETERLIQKIPPLIECIARSRGEFDTVA